MTSEPSAWSIPFYRSAALSLFLSGRGISAAKGTPVVVQTRSDNAIHVAVEPSIWGIPFCRSAALTLFIFVGLCIVAMSGETIKWSFLPLYMEAYLNAPTWIRGAVISTHPCLEQMLIPFGGWLSERVGAHRLILIGIACGIIAQLLFAAGNSIPLFIFEQVFSSILIATVLSLGMTVLFMKTPLLRHQGNS